jgi:hypothetical protein
MASETLHQEVVADATGSGESVYPPARRCTLGNFVGDLPLSSGPAFRARRWGQGFEYHCGVGRPVGR